jgi:hypothetical protein
MTEAASNVLLGGVLAIVGGLISQGISWLTLRTQLRHDAIEKRKAREYETKREIYLQLAEAYTVFVSQLSNIQHRDLNPTLFSEISTPLMIAASKAQMVTTAKTSALLDILNSEGWPSFAEHNA